MKLLVLAQIPPPVHGQSLSVQTLVEGLHATAPDIEVFHVNLALSRDTTDIGKKRLGKVFALLSACLRALRLRARHGAMTLYYIPAPGKRAALYRDWMVMFLCRPFFNKLVLHWHAAGLGEWLTTRATAPERWLTHLFLGRAALAIILARELPDDARAFAPRRLCVVANGVDIGAPPTLRAHTAPVCRLLFISACSRGKGLWAILDALEILQSEMPGVFHFTAAGPFENAADQRDFEARVSGEKLRVCVRYVGEVDAARKHALYAEADLFVFPTYYAHEAQPLVLIEALAHDLPIVTTRWRAIPGMFPAGCEHVRLIAPDATPAQLASAIAALQASGPAGGEMHAHYEKNFTRAAHLAALENALRGV